MKEFAIVNGIYSRVRSKHTRWTWNGAEQKRCHMSRATRNNHNINTSLCHGAPAQQPLDNDYYYYTSQTHINSSRQLHIRALPLLSLCYYYFWPLIVYTDIHLHTYIRVSILARYEIAHSKCVIRPPSAMSPYSALRFRHLAILISMTFE